MSGIMARVISLVNQKGGVGKTTTSINLSASLGKLGKRTLLIDLDPQGNTSTGLGINKGDITASVYDCLNGSVPAKKAIIKTRFTNLFIMPATINLAGIDIELIEMTHENNDFKMNEQLKSVLEPIKDNFDYIIIDCPPSLGLLTTNALVASDSVIIPVQCEYYALEGLGQLTNTISSLKQNINEQLEIEGILLTMFDKRTNLSALVYDEVKKFFPEKIFKTVIPRNVRLSEAPSFGEPILSYDKFSKGAFAYKALAKEVIKKNVQEA